MRRRFSPSLSLREHDASTTNRTKGYIFVSGHLERFVLPVSEVELSSIFVTEYDLLKHF